MMKSRREVKMRKFYRPLREEEDHNIISRLKMIINQGITPEGWQVEEVEEAERILNQGIIGADQEEWIEGLFE